MTDAEDKVVDLMAALEQSIVAATAARTEHLQLNSMFGVGLWVRCEDCPATEQAFAWHHRDYHRSIRG